jgi:hypothetical protein
MPRCRYVASLISWSATQLDNSTTNSRFLPEKLTLAQVIKKLFSFYPIRQSSFPEGGVCQNQAWMPTDVSIWRIPQMIWVWRATVEWYWQGKTEELGEKSVPVPLCPPQIPHVLTRAQTRASAVTGRWLTTWAMPRPIRGLSAVFLIGRHWTVLRDRRILLRSVPDLFKHTSHDKMVAEYEMERL